MVKRLRRSPLKAESGVRFPLGVPLPDERPAFLFVWKSYFMKSIVTRNDIVDIGEMFYISKKLQANEISQTFDFYLKIYYAVITNTNKTENNMQNKALVVIDIQNDITKNYK